MDCVFRRVSAAIPDVVRAERGRSYVDIDGILYWKRGLDGKHRNRNNHAVCHDTRRR